MKATHILDKGEIGLQLRSKLKSADTRRNHERQGRTDLQNLPRPTPLEERSNEEKETREEQGTNDEPGDAPENLRIDETFFRSLLKVRDNGFQFRQFNLDRLIICRDKNRVRRAPVLNRIDNCLML